MVNWKELLMIYVKGWSLCYCTAYVKSTFMYLVLTSEYLDINKSLITTYLLFTAYLGKNKNKNCIWYTLSGTGGGQSTL